MLAELPVKSGLRSYGGLQIKEAVSRMHEEVSRRNADLEPKVERPLRLLKNLLTIKFTSK